MKQKKGRRWLMFSLGPAYTTDEGEQLWCWVSWHLFERVSGVATEFNAVQAIEHFLNSDHRYSL